MDKQAAVEIAALYRRYITMVRSRAARLLSNPNMVEDVAQEVFIKFIEHRAAHGVEQNAAGLLYCITTRLCMDRLRSKYRQAAVFAASTNDPDRAMVVDRAMAAQDGFAEGIDDKLALEQALQHVSGEERSIGESYYWGDMDQPEIAAAINVPRRTVARRLERFRDRMRKLLDLRDEKQENSIV
jgi:RNA polymerase sigma factor (sigma-70 family)